MTEIGMSMEGDVSGVGRVRLLRSGGPYCSGKKFGLGSACDKNQRNLSREMTKPE